MLSAHEKLTGTRYKPIMSYWAETRDRYQSFPFNCGLRKARKLAQSLANEWGETVHLLRRAGARPSEYVPGQALYHPQDQGDFYGLSADLSDEQMCSAWPDCGHTEAECVEAGRAK